jgi:hypothetical protein
MSRKIADVSFLQSLFWKTEACLESMYCSVVKKDTLGLLQVRSVMDQSIDVFVVSVVPSRITEGCFWMSAQQALNLFECSLRSVLV